jgi:hypothetical protein
MLNGTDDQIIGLLHHELLSAGIFVSTGFLDHRKPDLSGTCPLEA